MKDLRYVLISPHAQVHGDRELVNRTYDHWKGTFVKVLSAKGTDLHTDDFFRYDMIGVLMQGERFVGSHFYSLFDLNLKCCLEHHFFDGISSETLRLLRNRGNNLIYSLEYTNVEPEFRKDQDSVRWVEVLTGCALKVLDASSADGMIGTPRTDLKVNLTAMRMGAKEIQSPFKKMNYECSVIFWTKESQRQLYSERVQTLVDQAWMNMENQAAEPAYNLKAA